MSQQGQKTLISPCQIMIQNMTVDPPELSSFNMNESAWYYVKYHVGIYNSCDASSKQ